jgi:hypothetical protein
LEVVLEMLVWIIGGKCFRLLSKETMVLVNASPRLGLYRVPTILVEPSSDHFFLLRFLRIDEEFEG